jgi:hypothetical protein
MTYRYFNISQGIRGCYMPDSAYESRFKTRKELKAALEWEARDIREAGFVGLNKRAVAWLANAAWKAAAPKAASSYFPFVAPYRRDSQPGNYCFGLFVAKSNRADWKAFEEETR